MHVFLHLVGRKAQPEEEHQLGDGGLGGAVISADDAVLLQVQSRLVALHLHAAGLALRDVHYYNSFLHRLADELHEPFGRGCIPAAERLEHHALQSLHAEDRLHVAGRDAGIEFEERDVRVERKVGFQGLAQDGPVEVRPVVLDRHPGVRQRGVVVGVERVEIVGARLARPVPAHQVVFEEDADLLDEGKITLARGGYLDRRQEVLLPIRAEHPQWQLRAGQDDGLTQILEHEAERRGGKGHRVRPVQDDETVVRRVMVGNEAGEAGPRLRTHVGRVERLVELHCLDGAPDLPHLRYLLQKAREMKGLEPPRLLVLHHADGPARINQQDRCLPCLVIHVRLCFYACKDTDVLLDFRPKPAENIAR